MEKSKNHYLNEKIDFQVWLILKNHFCFQINFPLRKNRSPRFENELLAQWCGYSLLATPARSQTLSFFDDLAAAVDTHEEENI